MPKQKKRKKIAFYTSSSTANRFRYTHDVSDEKLTQWHLNSCTLQAEVVPNRKCAILGQYPGNVENSFLNTCI